MSTIKRFFAFTFFFFLYVAISASMVPRRPLPHGRLPSRGRVLEDFVPESRIIDEFIVAHNAVRSLIGYAPLTWNSNVTWYAEQWARKRVNDCKLIHSMGPYGENLFWGGGATYWSPTTVVESWAAEKAFYDPISNSCARGQVCGHYTQIVWKDTLSFGCAEVRCNDNKGTFVICSYDPPGNYVNEHPYGNLSDVEKKSTIDVTPVEGPNVTSTEAKDTRLPEPSLEKEILKNGTI